MNEIRSLIQKYNKDLIIDKYTDLVSLVINHEISINLNAHEKTQLLKASTTKHLFDYFSLTNEARNKLNFSSQHISQLLENANFNEIYEKWDEQCNFLTFLFFFYKECNIFLSTEQIMYVLKNTNLNQKNDDIQPIIAFIDNQKDSNLFFDPEVVDYLLKNSNLNQPDYNDEMFFLSYCSSILEDLCVANIFNQEQLNYIVEKSNVNYKNNDGLTTLMAVIVYNNQLNFSSETIDLLIEKTDFSIKNNNGLTYLDYLNEYQHHNFTEDQIIKIIKKSQILTAHNIYQAFNALKKFHFEPKLNTIIDCFTIKYKSKDFYLTLLDTLLDIDDYQFSKDTIFDIIEKINADETSGDVMLQHIFKENFPSLTYHDFEKISIKFFHKNKETNLLNTILNNTHQKIEFSPKQILQLIENSDLKTQDKYGYNTFMYAFSNPIKQMNQSHYQELITQSDLNQINYTKGQTCLDLLLKNFKEKQIILSTQQWLDIIKKSNQKIKANYLKDIAILPTIVQNELLNKCDFITKNFIKIKYLSKKTNFQELNSIAESILSTPIDSLPEKDFFEKEKIKDIYQKLFYIDEKMQITQKQKTDLHHLYIPLYNKILKQCIQIDEQIKLNFNIEQLVTTLQQNINEINKQIDLLVDTVLKEQHKESKQIQRQLSFNR